MFRAYGNFHLGVVWDHIGRNLDPIHNLDSRRDDGIVPVHRKVTREANQAAVALDDAVRPLLSCTQWISNNTSRCSLQPQTKRNISLHVAHRDEVVNFGNSQEMQWIRHKRLKSRILNARNYAHVNKQ
jgi:hypothetical protein